MPCQRISASVLATVSGLVRDPVVTIEDGQIAGIESGGAGDADYSFAGGVLAPGLLDIHFHGIAGEDVMSASAEGFRRIARRQAQAGVSQFLPTTVTASRETTLRALEGMAGFVEAPREPGLARGAGIHIEGPFLSHDKRGMHPAQHLVQPTPRLLDELWEAARGHIRLMTIAPELPGALETIAHAVELGIRCSIGHSMATAAEAVAGIEAGAVSATHTFNAMRPLDHREPGILGVTLDRESLYADLICDGQHVSAEGVRLWLKAKGPERAILITDCLSAAGRPDGSYTTGDTVVRVEGDACRTEAGVLAGSVITLDRALANLVRMTGADLPTATRMASSNPARMLGLCEPLAIGAAADFNVYGAGGERLASFVGGVPVQ